MRYDKFSFIFSSIKFEMLCKLNSEKNCVSLKYFNFLSE